MLLERLRVWWYREWEVIVCWGPHGKILWKSRHVTERRTGVENEFCRLFWKRNEKTEKRKRRVTHSAWISVTPFQSLFDTCSCRVKYESSISPFHGCVFCVDTRRWKAAITLLFDMRGYSVRLSFIRRAWTLVPIAATCCCMMFDQWIWLKLINS